MPNTPSDSWGVETQGEKRGEIVSKSFPRSPSKAPLHKSRSECGRAKVRSSDRAGITVPGPGITLPGMTVPDCAWILTELLPRRLYAGAGHLGWRQDLGKGRGETPSHFPGVLPHKKEN